MAAKNLLEAMDHLWFHQIILLSKPSPFQSHQDSKKMEQESNNTSQESLISEQGGIFLEENSYEESVVKERPTRLILLASKARCHSFSPISSQNRSRNLPKLQKTMSCKSLIELELEEVKGFMDLGFIFPRENLSKNVINLLPGLQRIDDEDDDDEREIVMRPYLSEAWIIKRPDSPLLSLRIPRISTTEDMKKHLKNWAQTVASAIRQDS